MRLATIDVGTNTALLLVADVTEEAGIQVVHEAERFVRLGQGVDRDGRINDDALERLRRVLLAYRETAERYDVRTFIVAGTSASRDAQNQTELITFVRQQVGLDYEILSGEDEARWSFAGTVSAFPELQGRCAVLDVGGGSTELVLGEPGALPASAHSFNVGSVRLSERHFDRQPPSRKAVARAEADVRAALVGTSVALDASVPLIGTAGTPLCLAHVEGWSWEALYNGEAVLDAATIHQWRERLFFLTHDEVLDLAPRVMPGRADVFPTAVLILDVFMQHFGLPSCRISLRGLRHGLALRYLEQELQAG